MANFFFFKEKRFLLRFSVLLYSPPFGAFIIIPKARIKGSPQLFNFAEDISVSIVVAPGEEGGGKRKTVVAVTIETCASKIN